MTDETDTNGGERADEDAEQRRGVWLGEATGMAVRAPGEDADHPLLELHGDEGVAAVEIPPDFTDAFSHMAAELDMAREDSEPEVRTDGGARVLETERCHGAGEDECVREDPELTRGEDAIHVTKYGPRHSKSGRQVLCSECKDKQVAVNIAENPDVAYLYREEITDLRERFPEILGDVDIPVTDGGEDVDGVWEVECPDCGSVMPGGGGECIACEWKSPSTQWEQRAEQNVQKWGEQDPGALALAMIEELGEVCRNLLLASHYADSGRRPEGGRDYIRRMADLGEETRDYLETNTEDSDGEPKHPEDRPNYLTYGANRLHMRHTREELDDLMALGYQFLWAHENTEYRGGGGD